VTAYLCQSRDVKKILHPRHIPEITEESIKDFLETNEVGAKLNKIWKSNLEHITLTSVGQLIGVYVSDGILDTKTIINW